MNTMELVRFMDRDKPRPEGLRPSAPLFFSKLLGPARQAIVRGRHYLLSEQSSEGSWFGPRFSDASLASQLIFLLVYLQDNESPLFEQAVDAIWTKQLPTGGWATRLGNQADVSVSVQTYLALKLAGIAANDERLQRARQEIRALGGAAAVDEPTRQFLALFGQIDYSLCMPLPPELLLLRKQSNSSQHAQSILWAHRASLGVDISSGVRELFLNAPECWPVPKASKPIRAVWNWLEGTHWNPLRSYALDYSEQLVLDALDETKISRLPFSELVLHLVALYARGISQESAPIQRGKQYIEELVTHDKRYCEGPAALDSRVDDTLCATEALLASGTATQHPAITESIKWLSRETRNRNAINAPAWANALRVICQSDAEGLNDCLPIELQSWSVNSAKRWTASGAIWLASHARKLRTAFVKELLESQQKNGGWDSLESTAAVLEAVSMSGVVTAARAIERAIVYLRRQQNADGSWHSTSAGQELNSTALIVRALAAAGVHTECDTMAVATNWILAHQAADGSWASVSTLSASRSVDTNEFESESSSYGAITTAQCLLALVATGHSNDAACLRAANWLVENQSDLGRWNDVSAVEFDENSKRWVSKEFDAAILPLIALSRWIVAAASSQPKSVEPVQLRLVGNAN